MMAEEGFKLKLAAILSIESACYSRFSSEQKAVNVQTIKSNREIMV
jgi:hypothetical protein